MLLIVDNQVLEESRVVTDTQTAIVRRFHTLLHRITAEADRTELTTGSVAAITLQWEVYDLINRAYVVDPNNVTPVHVNVAGQTAELIPDNGTTQLTFSADEPGEFTICTINDLVDNLEMKVVVHPA